MSKYKKKKKKYPRFDINRLQKKWPFSLELAINLFRSNQSKLYSSLRAFFISTTFYLEDELEEEESDYLKVNPYLSYSEKNKMKHEIIGKMDIWEISHYPGFFIKNNKVHYKETIKAKVQNSTKEDLSSKIYTLDNIPYETIICEGAKFYINSFLQGSVVNFSTIGLKLLSVSLIWEPVFNYLLWTTCSSSMKNMLENQNYIKTYEEEILYTFKFEFKKIKESFFDTRLKKLLSKTERSVFKERLLNVFLISGISENKSKILINNFFLTESLDEIICFYQELLSKF